MHLSFQMLITQILRSVHGSVWEALVVVIVVVVMKLSGGTVVVGVVVGLLVVVVGFGRIIGTGGSATRYWPYSFRFLPTFSVRDRKILR